MRRKKFIQDSITVISGAAIGLNLKQYSGQEPANFKSRFGILTDPHYADKKAKNTRFYKDSMEKLQECVDLMNQEKVDFLIELGDFIESKGRDMEVNLKALRDFERAFGKFKGPRYHVLGNHDTGPFSKTQFLREVTNTGFPEALSFYSFNNNNVHFVVLDGAFRSDGQPYDSGNFNWKDSYIPPFQIEWLERDLKENTLPAIIFCHQQLDEPGYQPNHAHYCPTNSADVRQVLEGSGKVLAVFQGHYHKGGFNVINDIPYYTLKAMIEGEGLDNNSYGIVEIKNDLSISIKGYRMAISQELKAKKI